MRYFPKAFLPLVVISTAIVGHAQSPPGSQPAAASQAADPFNLCVKFENALEVNSTLTLDQPFTKRVDVNESYYVISGVCSANADGTFTAKLVVISWSSEGNNCRFGTTPTLTLDQPANVGFLDGFVHNYTVTLTRTEKAK